MDASRQNWIAQQHGAQATINYSGTVIDGMGALMAGQLQHGDVLALALDEAITEDAIRAELGSDFEILSAEHAPATHDRFVLARRTVTKKKK